ncbi:MAG: nickel pincer cofactor biosynthesis protein LarC [Bryobacteraceae bacterium]|nr:nickel pincer cofactor biosynthesis protein LarC [Bryobacteraceae bacterium]MDW8378206.1 nickel pincer cofactor biosynthesis protein LarC [Bryobacterales bacterium]
MKIGYWDAFSGISGDMAVGSLIDAGAPFAEVVAGLESLGTGARFRQERVRRRGFVATKFYVDFEPQKHHRHLPRIEKMIEAADLPEAVKQHAIQVFLRLGEAEAKVHGVPLEEVHFHEVGAVDSICDIVGACLGLHLLGIRRAYCSPLNLGSGSVQTEHGRLPVPAPATAELLAGKPVYADGPACELTTPTGAALAVTLCAGFGAMPPMRISNTGYGAGEKDFEQQANLLRLVVGEDSTSQEAAVVSVIEANIDDASPQILGYAMERLLSAGALDVSFSPLWMKKNRQGVLLRVLAAPELQEKLAGIVFSETTTLGLRITRAERRVQPRKTVEVKTPHGAVRMKVSADGAFAPEYEDCRRLASENNVPLKQIIQEANYAYLSKFQ